MAVLDMAMPVAAVINIDFQNCVTTSPSKWIHSRYDYPDTTFWGNFDGTR